MRPTHLAPVRFGRAALAAVLLLAASPLAAYTIYLKDGSSITARDKYTVQGDTALIVFPNGSQTTLPLSQIDVARTKSANASDFGSATVLRGPAPTPPPPQGPRAPTLGELSAQHRNQSLPPPRRPPTAPVAASATAETPKGAARTSAGNVDFLRAPRTPLSRLDLGTTIGEMLRAHGVSNASLFEGTEPRRLLVEVTANSEGAVFQAIAGAAQAMLDFEAKQPRAIEGLELFIATDRRARAGQFLITPARAQELVSKQLDLTAFYLKYVEF
jgi:hypothetical protein